MQCSVNCCLCSVFSDYVSVNSVWCALFIVQCDVCSVLGSVCSVKCAVCLAWYVVCSVRCALCVVQCAVIWVQCAVGNVKCSCEWNKTKQKVSVIGSSPHNSSSIHCSHTDPEREDGWTCYQWECTIRVARVKYILNLTLFFAVYCRHFANIVGHLHNFVLPFPQYFCDVVLSLWNLFCDFDLLWGNIELAKILVMSLSVRRYPKAHL